MSPKPTTSLREVVRVYDWGGLVPIEAAVLFMDVGSGYKLGVAEPPATITTGHAVLRDAHDHLTAEFFDDWPQIARTEDVRLMGPAVSIRLEDSSLDHADIYPLTQHVATFFSAFRALNAFLALYRVSKFQANPTVTMTDGRSPWDWLDPGRPDIFTEFLGLSYVVFDAPDGPVVEASLAPKAYAGSNLDIAALRNAMEANLAAMPPQERLLMLDAWVALYDGNIRSAIILANTALEAAIRRILIDRLEPIHGPKAQKRTDELLKNLDFSTQLEVALPLAGVQPHLSAELRKASRELREYRTSVVHRGDSGPDWSTSQALLLDTERVLREIHLIEGKFAPIRIAGL